MEANQVTTTVVGRVGTEKDEDEAIYWISGQLKSLQVGAPDDIYFKDEVFKALFVCKFGNHEKADKVMKELAKRKPSTS